MDQIHTVLWIIKTLDLKRYTLFKGMVLKNSTPGLFTKHACQVIESVKEKPMENGMCLLN